MSGGSLTEVRKLSNTANYADPRFLADNPAPRGKWRRLNCQEQLAVGRPVTEGLPDTKIANGWAYPQQLFGNGETNSISPCVPNACLPKRLVGKN